MYKLEKDKLVHNVAKFVNDDNLITLGLGLVAGIKLLEQEDALELLSKLDNQIEVKWHKQKS